jgi:hypothetical protein
MPIMDATNRKIATRGTVPTARAVRQRNASVTAVVRNPAAI